MNCIRASARKFFQHLIHIQVYIDTGWNFCLLWVRGTALTETKNLCVKM